MTTMDRIMAGLMAGSATVLLTGWLYNLLGCPWGLAGVHWW